MSLRSEKKPTARAYHRFSKETMLLRGFRGQCLQLNYAKPVAKNKAPHLALIVLLDQFRRNVYRETQEAFAADDRALALCREGIAAAMDTELSIIERAFFTCPCSTSRIRSLRNRGVEAFRRLVAESTSTIRSCIVEFHSSAVQHQLIIARFGRFPHRNGVLDRSSTAAELAYLLRERIPFRK
jgi:uncharacterized protein (DUF924 family)